MSDHFNIGDRISFKPKGDFETLALEINKRGNSNYSARLVIDGVEALGSGASISSSPESVQLLMLWIITDDAFLGAHDCWAERSFLRPVGKRTPLRVVKKRARNRRSRPE